MLEPVVFSNLFLRGIPVPLHEPNLVDRLFELLRIHPSSLWRLRSLVRTIMSLPENFPTSEFKLCDALSRLIETTMASQGGLEQGKFCPDCYEIIRTGRITASIKLRSNQLLTKLTDQCALCKRSLTDLGPSGEAQVLMEGALILLADNQTSRAKSLMSVAASKSKSVTVSCRLACLMSLANVEGVGALASSLVGGSNIFASLGKVLESSGLADCCSEGGNIFMVDIFWNASARPVNKLQALTSAWVAMGSCYFAYITSQSDSKGRDCVSTERAWFEENIKKLPRVVACFIAAAHSVAARNNSTLCTKFAEQAVSLSAKAFSQLGWVLAVHPSFVPAEVLAAASIAGLNIALPEAFGNVLEGAELSLFECSRSVSSVHFGLFCSLPENQVFGSQLLRLWDKYLKFLQS